MNDIQTLARVVQMTHAIRENSYAPLSFTIADDGTRMPAGGGFYTLNHTEAAQQACTIGGYSTAYITPASLMLTYPSEALAWAREVLAETVMTSV